MIIERLTGVATAFAILIETAVGIAIVAGLGAIVLGSFGFV